MHMKSIHVPDSSWKISSLFHELQEVSGESASQFHASGPDLEKYGLMWVVVRYELNFKKTPVPGDRLLIQTWALPFRHKLSQRNYVLSDKDGNAVITAAGVWAIVDRCTRNMVEPEQFPIHLPEEKNEIMISRPAAPNKLDTSYSDEYIVIESDLDTNLHMNNTRYFDLAEDRINRLINGNMHLKQVRAAYLTEARMGERIHLDWAYKDGSAYCHGQKSGSECFQIGFSYNIM